MLLGGVRETKAEPRRAKENRLVWDTSQYCSMLGVAGGGSQLTHHPTAIASQLACGTRHGHYSPSTVGLEGFCVATCHLVPLATSLISKLIKTHFLPLIAIIIQPEVSFITCAYIVHGCQDLTESVKWNAVMLQNMLPIQTRSSQTAQVVFYRFLAGML